MSQTRLFITHHEPGFHNWPEADLERPWAYLKHPHRHTFSFYVEFEPPSSYDRALEFIDTKHRFVRWLRSTFTNPDRDAHGLDFQNLSCEALAKHIALTFVPRDLRKVKVEVSEDGECGASYVREDLQEAFI